MKKILMCAAVLSLAVFTATAQANLLDDGSLEAGQDGTQTTNSAWTLVGNDPNSVAAGVYSASAWAAKDGAQGIWFQSFNGDPDPNGGGFACGGQCDLTLSQSVAAPTSGDYVLTFWSAREVNHLADSDIASLSSSGTGGTDSLDLFTATYNDALNMGDGGGTQFTLSLSGVTAGDILTASVAMVNGRSNPGASESLMVDLFDLNFVPEPTSIVLASLGMMGLFSMRRKR